MLGLPGERDARARLEGVDRLVGEAVADDAARRRVDVELRVHAEVDDLDDRPLEPSSPRRAQGLSTGADLDALGAHRDAERVTARVTPERDRHDDALALAEPHDRERADELVDGQVERVERADEVGDEGGRRMLVDLARACRSARPGRRS